ncbi:cGMP-dependent protein kinase, partial [Fasciola hepatica]
GIILNKGHDHSDDHRSFGILIFKLLTVSPPFTGSNPKKIYNVVQCEIDAMEFSPIHINRTAAILIKRLYAQNPTQRFGHGFGGVIDIKLNKYFQGFDWIGAHQGTLVAPIQPTIAGPDYVSNFDKYPEKAENPPDEHFG